MSRWDTNWLSGSCLWIKTRAVRRKQTPRYLTERRRPQFTLIPWSVLLIVFVSAEEERLKEWKEEEKGKRPDGWSVRSRAAWLDVQHNAEEISSFIHICRTLQSLCRELVEQGLLKQTRNVQLQDFLGKTRHTVTEMLLSNCNLFLCACAWCAGTPQEVHHWAVLSRNYGAWMCCPLLARVAKTNLTQSFDVMLMILHRLSIFIRHSSVKYRLNKML